MCRPPTPSDVQEDERNARVALFGTGPVPSPLFLQIGKELPRNLVSCDTGRESGIGAFACGAYKTSAPRRPPTALAADLERLRRVSIFGTRPAVSRTNECVKAELPRNLVSCDHAREPTGAFVCTCTPARMLRVAVVALVGLAAVVLGHGVEEGGVASP